MIQGTHEETLDYITLSVSYNFSSSDWDCGWLYNTSIQCYNTTLL